MSLMIVLYCGGSVHLANIRWLSDNHHDGI